MKTLTKNIKTLIELGNLINFKDYEFVKVAFKKDDLLYTGELKNGYETIEIVFESKIETFSNGKINLSTPKEKNINPDVLKLFSFEDLDLMINHRSKWIKASNLLIEAVKEIVIININRLGGE